MNFERLEHRTLLAGTIAGDFNGDGFEDLAIGSPRDTVSGKTSAGSVSVMYGSADGITSTGNQLWSMDTPGVNGHARASDFFGNALAVGDFNGDGFDDLAIGSPARRVNGQLAAGAVNILYGSSNGLQAGTVDQQFTQATPGMNLPAAAFNAFGSALAGGDFDGDGFDDLAIGVPGANVDGNSGAGAAVVLYGTNNGLATAGNQLWSQESPGIDGHASALEAFGSALAVGDFNGDDRDDLVVGVPGDRIGGLNFAGAVNVIYGDPTGLRASGDQLIHEGLPDVPGGVQENDRWSTVIAVGDFDRDGFDDLAAGSPRSAVAGFTNAGEVNAFYGSADKLQTTGSQRFTAASWGIELKHDLLFASALTAAPFNGRDDLAIGMPGYDLGGTSNAGAVQIAYGSATGLTVQVGQHLFHEGTPGVAGALENGDRFGSALTAGDYNGDGRADLIVGIHLEDVGSKVDAGAILVLYGSPSGITPTDSEIWHRGIAGMLGVSAPGAWFGFALI